MTLTRDLDVDITIGAVHLGSETERGIVSVQRWLGRAARSLADVCGGRGPLLLFSTLVVLFVAGAASAQTTFTVSNDAQLRSAIEAVRDGDRIVLTNDITLASDLGPIQYDSVTIEGGGFTLSGGGHYRGLTFDPGGYRLTAYVNNLTIRDAATIDAGKDLPNGFDGRGGALLIANGASVYVSGVSLVSNSATGSVPSSPADTGGALFIQGGDSRFDVPAGQLIVTGSLTINGSTVGSAAGAAGAGLVMEGSGNVKFRPTSGQTMTINDAIVDVDSPRGLPGSGAWGLDLVGPGRLVLRGNNRYSGGTSVDGDGAVINVLTAANLGTGDVTVEHGGTLEIAGSSSFKNGLLLDEVGRISVGAGQTVTWNGHLTNEHSDLQSGILVVAGGGRLVLSDATNDYGAGTAVVDNSTLSVGADGALGRAGTAISLGNAQTRGTLGLTSSLTTARPVTLGAAGGGIDVSNGADAALTGTVGGPGGLTKSGGGSLALSGANTYAGPTTITGGTLRAGAANAFGTSGTMSIGSGATLDLNNFDYTFNTLSGDGDVTLGTAKLTTGSAGSSTLNGVISGAGALIKEGSGTFTLGGANTYSGGTFVHGGTLAGTTSSLQGAIANDATVAFRQDTDGTYAGTMTGTGALVKSGSGTLVLTGANTYSGGTTVSGGTLAGNTSTLQGDIVDNANVTFDQAQDGTFAGALSGSGGVTKNGGGALRLTGANSYAGGTAVNAGSLVGDARSLQGSMVNDATVVFEQGGDGTYGGGMSGGGQLIKNGGGALRMGGANSYSGGTTVNAGTLIGDANSLRGDIVNQGNVVFDQGGDGTYAGIMSGAGRLTKAGAGRLSLTGLGSYTGGTFVNAGTLVGDTSTLRGSIFVNGGQLEFNQREDGILQGSLAGLGSIAKSGLGRLTVNDAGSLGGLFTVLQGGVTLNGPMAGSAAIRSGADFLLNGNMSGSVTVDPGGIFNSLGSVGSLIVGGSWTVPIALVPPQPGLPRVSAVSGPQALDVPARFTVNGDLTTLPGSTVALEASGAQPPVQVNGNASFTGTQFNITVDDASRTRLKSYPLVSANAVTLANSTVTAQTPTLAPVLFADATTLRVSVLNLLIPLSEVPTAQNGRSVASALDVLKPGTGEMQSLIRNLAGLEDDKLRDAFDQMSGQVNVTNLKMVAMDSEAITDLIRNEMSRDAEDDLGITSSGRKNGFWVEAVGAHAKFSSTEDLSGADVNLGGLAGGYDVKSTDRYTFGGGLSFTGGSLSLNDLKEASQLNAPRGFGYAGVRIGPFRFHGGGSAAKTNTTSTREIHIQPADPSRDPAATSFDRTTQAERQGNASDAWTEWQDTIKFVDWTTETKIGWRHVRFARDPFTEQGGGPISLQSGDTTVTETESDVLVRSFKRSGFYRPYFMFTYRRTFGDESNSEDSQFVNQPNATFTVQGLPMAKNTVMGRTGLTINPGFGSQFTFEYEFRRAEFETRHTVDFRFRFK